MNQTELYFARQNFLWNFQKYFLIGLLIFFGILWIAACIEDWWRWKRPKKRKKVR